MRGAGQDGKEANAIMMKFPRMLYRSVLLLIYLPASYLYEVLTLLFRPDLRMAANRLGRILCRILGIRLIVEGEAPREFGGLIVSNHWGYLDIVTHSAVFRTLRFAAKSDIRRWPVLGWYLRIHRPIWIDRSNRQKAKEVADRIADTMRGGRSLLVYPEGTSSDGTAILPFKSTAFDPVIREGFPVLPVLTFYERPAEGGEIGWYGDMDFFSHFLHLLGLKKIVCRVYILERILPEPGDDRKILAEKVHRLMSEKYRTLTAAARETNVRGESTR